MFPDDVAVFRCACNLEDKTVMEKHGPEAQYSTVKSLMPAIRTEKQDALQDAAYQMIQIAKPWSIRRCSESKLAKGKPLVPIPKRNTHHVDFKWTEEEQAKHKTHVERYTSECACGA
jgi:hypothetical protein